MSDCSVTSLAVELFGGHVRGRARSHLEHRGCRAQPRVRNASLSINDSREAKIQNFDDAVASDEHVAGLEIAVKDAVAVRVGEGGRHLHSERNGFKG